MSLADFRAKLKLSCCKWKLSSFNHENSHRRDDPIFRRLLEKTLQVAGYDVLSVPNGLAAAEQLCKQDGPRLALLDWEMPELDGPAVCREVRKKKDQGYVYMVLLTSKGLKTDIVTGLGSGADDYLTKPFDSGELKARLRTGQRILHLEGRLVEARENMRFKATHDALTSLFNRGVIVELLGREISRSRRERVPTAIAIPFPLSAPPEEIRRSLSDTPVQTAVGPLLVTMSMGVHQTQNWGARTVEELLHEVDSAMYAAKTAGRNRISFTKPDTSPDEDHQPSTVPARSLR